MAMTTVRRESPFVQVYAANENTVVHIRQLIYNSNDQATPGESSDGVVMTLMQFRSLMFHSRALDAQFTQGVDFTQDEEKNNDGDENLYAKISLRKDRGTMRSVTMTRKQHVYMTKSDV